jgi:hypothetical protein
MNRSELKKTFNVSDKWVFNKRITYLKNLLADLKKERGRFFKLYCQASSKDAWLPGWKIEKIDDRIEKTEKSIYYLNKFKNNEGQDNYVDIETIKTIPIKDVADSFNLPLIKSTDKRYYCKLRNEKTPSCCIYREQNSFYDFGSKQGGSVIDFYMQLTGCSSGQAIKELKNYL